MTQKAEITALREEIAALRREIEGLRADRSVHHYHHQAAPTPFVQQPPMYQPPLHPGYYPATCGGKAISGLGDFVLSAGARAMQ